MIEVLPTGFEDVDAVVRDIVLDPATRMSSDIHQKSVRVMGNISI